VSLVLRNGVIEATVLAEKGADIYSLVHVPSGLDVLFKTTWGLRFKSAVATTTQERWLEAYPGGWQLLLPNGGDECRQYGATWGFHGEAALVPWRVAEAAEGHAKLETVLFTAPLRVERQISLDGATLRVRDVVTNTSPFGVEVMWSHHPAFGPPFLERGCALAAGCSEVVADDRAPGTVLRAGGRSAWPFAEVVAGGTTDLRALPGPDEPRSVLAYLTGFSSGWFTITNPRLGLGVGFRWPAEVFSCAWLWQEVHSTAGWPWFGRAYVVAVEPATTWPGQGMVNARAKGGRGVLLAGGSSQEAVVEAVLFEGSLPEDFGGPGGSGGIAGPDGLGGPGGFGG
jgi:hypothetical protein